jgi:diacylglycerol kinase family enzyme
MQPSNPFAVVLNANARRVNERVRHTLGEIVPPDDLYYSMSADDSRAITERILDRGYSTVFTGGGDGTVVEFINQVLAATSDGGSATPSIGILRLGTGNALAEMVSSGNYLCDLKSFVSNAHRDHHVLPLVQAEGAAFPFAGLGADAELLNDYRTLKGTLGDTFLSPMVQSVGGYFLALFARTVPRRVSAALRRHRSEIVVRNRSRSAALLGPGGTVVRTFGRGEVIYAGPSTITIVGTCPFYGYGLKALPFADRTPDAMHLRVVQMSIPGILGNLRSLWHGRYESPKLLDFLVDHVEIELSEPVPYQRAGDAAGYRDSIEFALSPKRVNLVRFI